MAAVSGLMLTGAFPNIDLNWLAWCALVPLLIAIQNLNWTDSRMGALPDLNVLASVYHADLWPPALVSFHTGFIFNGHLPGAVYDRICPPD